MKSLSRLFVPPLFCFVVLITGVPIAYAGCLDDASDAVIGLLSGGATVAACEMEELVQSIKNFIKLVSDLASNVVRNATDVANAAAGAVRGAADDIAGALNGAQRDLGNAANEAAAMAAPQIMAMAPITSPNPAGAGTVLARGGVQAGPAPMGTAQRAGKVGSDPRPTVAQITLPADPQRLRAALQRGTQQLNALQTSVEQGAARRINSALQRAGDQVASHMSAVGDIVQTALLAPINGLLDTLKDLVTHPTRLLDPIATIDGLVQSIGRNVVDTMNHINDVITKDATQTLQGVETDLQQAQGAADSGNKLLNAMRLAHQQKTDAALKQLESQLNATAPPQGGAGGARVMASGAYRFNTAHSKIQATLQKSVAPHQAIASKLKTDWAAIQTRHQVVKLRPLDVRTKQTAQNELDRMFRGKSPAEVENAKQQLMNRARQKFGSDPKLMASIEHNLNGYVHERVAPAALPPSPGGKQVLNPQPLSSKQGSGQNKQLPAVQK